MIRGWGEDVLHKCNTLWTWKHESEIEGFTFSRQKFTLSSLCLSLSLSFLNVSWHDSAQWKHVCCSSQTQHTCQSRKHISQNAADKPFTVKSWRMLSQRKGRRHTSLPFSEEVKSHTDLFHSFLMQIFIRKLNYEKPSHNYEKASRNIDIWYIVSHNYGTVSHNCEKVSRNY